MSGDDGLREAIALAICPGTYCESHGECLEDADAVLALPEIAALLARADAADRVGAIHVPSHRFGRAAPEGDDDAAP